MDVLCVGITTRPTLRHFLIWVRTVKQIATHWCVCIVRLIYATYRRKRRFVAEILRGEWTDSGSINHETSHRGGFIGFNLADDGYVPGEHDDVIKWKHFPRYWPFVRGIHRSPVNSPHKGPWRGALMLSLICTRINGWVNNGEAGDLRRHRAHYDVTVMNFKQFVLWIHNGWCDHRSLVKVKVDILYILK